MATHQLGKNLKTALLLAISLSLTGCFDIKGMTPAFVYPDEGIANIYTITEKCPVKAAFTSTVSASSLTGYVCLPAEQAAKIRREYERDCSN